MSPPAIALWWTAIIAPSARTTSTGAALRRMRPVMRRMASALIATQGIRSGSPYRPRSAVSRRRPWSAARSRARFEQVKAAEAGAQASVALHAREAGTGEEGGQPAGDVITRALATVDKLHDAEDGAHDRVVRLAP